MHVGRTYRSAVVHWAARESTAESHLFFFEANDFDLDALAPGGIILRALGVWQV
jgi:hypothetical protein